MPSVVPPAKKLRSSRSSNDIQSYLQRQPVSASSDQWDEPTLQDQKPSYADHGGAPLGVVEDMQALGQPPSGKVRARLKQHVFRKSGGDLPANFGRQVLSDGLDIGETTLLGSPHLFRPSISEESQLTSAPLVRQRFEKDADYQSKATARSDDSMRSTRSKVSTRDSHPARSEHLSSGVGPDQPSALPPVKQVDRTSSMTPKRPATVGTTRNRKHVPVATAVTKPNLVSGSAPSQRSASKPHAYSASPPHRPVPDPTLSSESTTSQLPKNSQTLPPRLFMKDFPEPGPLLHLGGPAMKNVVTDAMLRSIENGKEKTGEALEHVYCQGLSDPKVMQLLRRAIQYGSTAEETAAFHDVVFEAKRIIKAWEARKHGDEAAEVEMVELEGPPREGPAKQRKPATQRVVPPAAVESAVRSTTPRAIATRRPAEQSSPSRSRREKNTIPQHRPGAQQVTFDSHFTPVHETRQVTALSSPARGRRGQLQEHRDAIPPKARTQTPPALPVSDLRRNTRLSTSRATPDVSSSASKSTLNSKVPPPTKSISRDPISTVNGKAQDPSSPSRQARSISAASASIVKDTEPAHTNGMLPSEGDSKLAPASNTNGLKRTSHEANITSDERDRVLVAKKARLERTVYRESSRHKAPAESHLRSTRNAIRNTRGRIFADRQRERTPVAEPDLTSMNNIHSEKPEELSGSPLSDLSSPPSYRGGSPTAIATLAKLGSRKARTKQSPKKQSLPTSDNERGQETRQTPPLESDEQESDNNDFCSSCGGSGYLLCCDGCDKSFHFTCLDPPLDAESSQLNEPWYCHVCVSRRVAPPRHARGLFSALLSNLDKRNPTVFVPPSSIREYFEGVATSKDGGFTEQATVKARNRAGYDEPMDLLKTKDTRGVTILCYACGKSAAGKREIITCDSCSAHWHLDCTSPPLANPPFRDQFGRKGRDWLCPLHVEHELREIDPACLARQRKVHLRRPKNAIVRDTLLTRGQINQGVIDIVDDSSDDDDAEFGEDRTPDGVVYRLPSKGIKLDFIEKVKSSMIMTSGLQTGVQGPVSSDLKQPRFTKLPLLEKQTALSLLRLSDDNKDLGLGGTKLDSLLGSLIAEAPAAIVKELDEAAEMDAHTREMNDLRALEKLIHCRLAMLNTNIAMRN